MDKVKEFREMAKKLDEIKCPAFALWYFLPMFESICKRQMNLGSCENNTYEILAQLKYTELKKAAEEIRDVVAADLW